MQKAEGCVFFLFFCFIISVGLNIVSGLSDITEGALAFRVRGDTAFIFNP